MKKILIITYYWPPKGGVGVQRWLKLTKYLCKKKYEPIIYTPKGGVSPIDDTSLIKSIPNQLTVLKKSIFEPQKIFSFFFKTKYSSDFLIKKPSNFWNYFLIWIRSNFFFPDSRCFWIKPSIRFLNNYLTQNPVDVIISTGPPHSVHLIALTIKKKHNIKWIADFRDPWTEIEYFDKLPYLPFIKNQHKKTEKRVLSHADFILSVSESWANRLMSMGANKIKILHNGYDPDDYQDTVFKKDIRQFKIGHFGLYNKMRNHNFLWDIIQLISKENPRFNSDLKLLFAGEVYDNFLNNLQLYGLDTKLIYHTYLDHRKSINKMMECDLLLVTQGETKSVLGRLPAKIFEYLGAKRPILAIGQKNSDLEKLLEPISYAWFVDFDNKKLLYQTILKIYNARIFNYHFGDDISGFSRENQASDVINLINDL